MALTVDGRTLESIVRALQVTLGEEGTMGAAERAEVEAAHKAAVVGPNPIGTRVYELGLYDGLAALAVVEQRIAGVDEVDGTVVAECDVVDFDALGINAQHREVADGTLCLSAVTGQDDVFGLVGQSHQFQVRIGNLVAVWRRYLVAFVAYGKVIRIVHPVDARRDVEYQGVLARRLVDGGKGVPDRSEEVRRRVGFLLAQVLVQQEVILVSCDSRQRLYQHAESHKYGSKFHDESFVW